LVLLCLQVEGLPYDCGVIPNRGFGIDVVKSEFELEQVFVVMRHGDRTPAASDACWPNDNAEWNCQLSSLSVPSDSSEEQLSVPRLYRQVHFKTNEVLKGTCLVGQLTSRGYEQQIANGKLFRQTYVNKLGFLPSKLNSSLLFIRSDNVPRTIQSAQSMLLGLYPPDTSLNETEILDIFIRDTDLDDLVENCQLCPKLCQVNDEAKTSSAYKTHIETVTLPFLKQLSKIFGYNVTLDKFSHLMDCLVTHVCHSFSIPNGASAIYDQGVNETVWLTNYTMSYPNITYHARLGIGFLISDIVDQMIDGIKGNSATKFHLYSGHDTTLFPLLVAFGAVDGKWPHYASYLIFEVYSLNNTHYVRMLYNGNELKLGFCNGQVMCPYNKFMQYVSTIVPSNNNECLL